MTEEEFRRCVQANDAGSVAEKADAYIRELFKQVETVRAEADAGSITAEQTCSLLEQKYISLSSEFAKLDSQNAQLQSSLDRHLADLALLQSNKHQQNIHSIGKDGKIEKLATEVSELHKSKRQLIELVEQKDLEISEKNATIKSYLDKIVNSSNSASQREVRVSELESELARTQAACTRLKEEKELVERHNAWLNDELTAKVDSVIELRRKSNNLEDDMSAKLADVERQFSECSSSLQWHKERVRELEMKLTSLQEELCSSKAAAAANEERLSAELSTVNKLVELYKESSEEWSRKAGELEGVIKALETHLSQVENDYKERLEKEVGARNQFEKEAAELKEKLEKCEADIESSRKSNELNLVPLSNFSSETWMTSFETNDMVEDDRMIVPKIPAGVSGTALAASLLRDGWSLAKMYAKYQEAVDALRHEQLGRKQSEAILQRVLYELEEKAEVILEERVEHERMAEAYSMINQRLQNSLSEQANLEKTIQELKADLRRHERDYNLAQKEIFDLQKQVTVLLKECRDIQLRCGSTGLDGLDDGTTAVGGTNLESDTEKVISERLLTFKDINGLVEQNVQLRSLVRSLSDEAQSREMEFKETFEMELKKHTDEAASKVAAVLQRAEEQGRMIESLHTSVAMYKRLYEEEHKLQSSLPHSAELGPDNRRTDLKLLLERSQEASKKAHEQAVERVKCLEEELSKSRSEIISLRSDRDKLALESNFARERLESFMKEFEHQRNESNGILARNVEFSQLVVDYQRKLRESSESLHAAEERSRKLTMEVSVLKQEKEMLSNAEKRACTEVCSLSVRVHRLQASLDTIQSAEEVREEARVAERRKQEEYVKHVELEAAMQLAYRKVIYDYNRRTDLKLLLERSQEASKKAHEQAVERVKCLEEELSKSRSEIISLRSDRDKLALESNFARERLESFMKEFEHQRNESNGILARNVEFSQLVVDYQRKLRESSESLHAAEERSRKLTMEVSVLKQEKEMLSNAEKRACTEVCSLSERVHRLQASLDTIQSAEEVREEARVAERRKQEEYVKHVEREWAEAKRELQEERDNVRNLTVDREQTLKNAMRQVEEMGKELADALRAVEAAESRAAVAEAKLLDLERKSKSSDAMDIQVDGGNEPSSFSSNEVVVELRMAKEEIEKLKVEAQANKDHMQQYKSIAQVNEDALRQMECAHETFKIEADKLKKSLEAELLSLRERVSELEYESGLKSEEVASVAAGNEETLASSLAEITILKEEISVKTSQVLEMEIQISAVKEDLEKEHQRWRAAQANYERQVILQSETIQELTKTSQTLASLQQEASELRKLADAHRSENNELKAKWEVEKAMLEGSKNDAEKKYNEINEQNKILHSRLEALHIQLAERDRHSAGMPSGSTGTDTLADSGLQNVINYLRRSKEIAETEISLLKQEKLRLQSQLESALKAAETSQASLQANRANSRALLFTEEEIKSLQLQVREMNLLRESNMQLREENKHNFEECQKLREITQKARTETENLESLLRERQIEVEACKKEIEMQKVERDNLETRFCELLERCKNIDVDDYNRMKDDVQQMQEKLKDKDAQIVEIRKLLSERQDIISKLEQDLSKCKLDLNEREKRINDILLVEANSKQDVERQKKIVIQFKRKYEIALKEKEELSKENQTLSKQLEESKHGKRSVVDTTGEQAMKEEKDTKIQTLEKHLERLREELRKEKDRRSKIEKAIRDSYNNVDQDKTKFVNELEMHKLALKRISDELQKLKHAKDNLPEGTSVVQLLSGTVLDDLAAAYVSAVENFQKTAHLVFSELGARGSLVEPSSIADTALTAAAAETSQASLQANRANSRALLFTEEEIKSLQLQVREMNLLRESNMQLREENKHNFEECQKLREITQKARTETENLESLLRERQIEVEACKKEIEMQKVERDNLETRFCELLERCKNIDVDDYNRMKDDVQQMQEKLKDKDAQIVEIRKLLSERQDIISKLEQDLSKCKLDLNEREKRINDILLVEANSKQDVERQKKIVIQFKRKYEIALKEKEELSKENQTLSKQLEESKHGKRSVVDTTGEQAMKEEKDTKIQTLEKHLERLREELRKEKDRRSKIEKAIRDSYNNVDQDKTKFVNELEMHKQALKRISDELQKLKHAKDNLPEGTSVVQLLSGTVLDDLAAAYVSAVENFQKTAHLVFSELGARGSLVEPSSIADTALTAAAGPAVSVQAPSIAFSAGPATSGSPAKATEESEKRFTLPKAIVETRKTGRKLNRPRLVRPEEPQGDIEMSEVDGARNVGKAAPSSDIEAQGNLTLISQPLVRKRIASASASDLHDESVIQGETGSDVAAPLLKKSKGLEPAHESSEGQFAVPVENLGTLQAPEETLNVVELAQASNEEAMEADKEEIETTGERTEDGREQLDGVSQDELLSEKNNVLEENLDRPGGSEMVSDEGPKDQAEPDNQQLMTESGSEREEGELEPDVTELEGGGGDISNIIGSPEPGEGQPEPVASPLASPARADDESLAAVTLEVGEINSPEVLNDEKNDEGDVNEETAEGSDKSNDGNDQIPVETDQVMEALCVPLESASASASSEIDVSKQGIPVSKQGSLTVTTEAEVVRQASPVSSTSTTINLSERARQNAAKRLGVASSPVVRGGRGRAAPRARGSRGRGRLGRGQSSGEQG
nr:nuclear-pore anchor [Quercus suber]